MANKEGKIFLDLDDTLMDTENFIRSLLKSEFYDLSKCPCVYSLRSTDEFSDIIEDIFNNYDLIPMCEGSKKFLDCMKDDYEIIFCSGYFTENERKSKKSFADKIGKDIILVDARVCFDKSCVDMSDGIVIDDLPEVLAASKAKIRLLKYNKYVRAYYNSFAEYAQCSDSVVETLADSVKEIKELREAQRAKEYIGVFKGMLPKRVTRS